MKSIHYLFSITMIYLLMTSCSTVEQKNIDIINDPFLQSQQEIKEAVEGIARDAQSANLEGLTSIHLNSKKFTKFGPRNFERQDVNSTNETESAHFGSVENLTMEIKDLKVDVFGDIGIATYYPHVTFTRDGEQTKASARQTLVFLNTDDGWKIIHEHGTMKPVKEVASD